MKNDFYRTSAFERREDTLSCMLHYNAAHAIFQGHFPGNPIVPGVCTMAMVKELLEEALQQKLMLKESRAVKFLGLINSSMSPTMILSWKEDAGQISVTASLQDEGGSLFKMSGNYVRAIPQ